MKVQLYRTGDFESIDDAVASDCCYTLYAEDDDALNYIKRAVHLTAQMFGYDSSDYCIWVTRHKNAYATE